MSSAILTIYGIESYMQAHNDSLFADVIFPVGIDKEIAVNECIINSGEFEVIYSDANFLKEAITHWSKAYYSNFEKLYKAFTSEFNPVENYDRYESITDSTVSNHSSNANSNNTGNTTENVSAFDSNDMIPNSSNTDISNTNASTSSNESITTGHEAHIHGNIGVTTGTQMLTEFTNFYSNKNLYKSIADMFTAEFCIMIY